MPGGGPLLKRRRQPPPGLPQFSEPSHLSCKLMTAQAARVVATHYDIGKVQGVDQLHGGYTNLSFSVTAENCGRFKKYLLRIYRQGTAVEHICFEHALIEHIVAAGGNMVAGLVKTREGDNFLRLPAPSPRSSKELYYAMFEFIGGEDKYTWTSNRLSDTEYTCSGRMLAELHCCAAGFDPGKLPSPHRPIIQRLLDMPSELANCAEQANNSCFDRYFLKNLPDVLDTCRKTSDRLTGARKLPVIGIHGDFHPGNQKYNLNRVVGVFDFDRACLDLRLFDVALAIIYFCTSWEGKMDGNLWLRKAALFLQGYQKRAGRSTHPGPLTPEEIGYFIPMLNAACLSLIKWASADAYYLETENCPDEEYLFYLKHHVRLVRWLENNRTRVENMLFRTLIQQDPFNCGRKISETEPLTCPEKSDPALPPRF